MSNTRRPFILSSNEPTLPIAILYHGNCTDGFGAAYAAYSSLGDTAEYIPCSYGDIELNLESFSNKIIYLLDFSLPKKQLEQLAEVSSSVTVIDHHKTAKDDLEKSSHSKLFIQFDMKRSGAGMSWDYFRKYTNRPQLIDYIEDRDLWTFKFGELTQKVNAGLSLYPFDFKLWDSFMTDEGLEKLIQEGSYILKYRKVLIEKFVKKAYIIEDILGLKKVPFSNVPPEFASEVGMALSEIYGIAVMYVMSKNTIHFSLRSTEKFPDIDVSEICKRYGGGGHVNASGFYLDISGEFDFKELLKK